MTNSLLPVTPADRKAVQDFHRVRIGKLMAAIEDEKAGARLGDDEGDAGDLVQAFARHRLAHQTPPATQPSATVGEVERLQAMAHTLRHCAITFGGVPQTKLHQQAADAIDAYAATLHTPPPVATATVVEAGWREIGSAPLDGTVIDLWLLAPDKRHGQRVPDVMWDTNRSFHGGIGRVAQPDAWVHARSRGELYLDGSTPTHWRATPTPPAGDR